MNTPAAATVTALKLQQLSRKCDYTALAPRLQKACTAWAITTPRRVRHFVAQLCVESLGLTRFQESLNYSAERMAVVWPGRYAIDPRAAVKVPNALARRLEHNPQALANNVYGGRMGNDVVNDGWTYRGRGPGMLTGRAQYALAQHETGLPLLAQPDLLLDAAVGFEVAAHHWATNGCNQIVDADPGEKALASIEARIRANEEDDLRAARVKVNGGLIGLDDARKWLIVAGGIWGD